jgi:ABC-type glycerol-3-phosphate transport system substrate-binding protein
MRRALASMAALLCSLTVLTACSGSDSPDEADTGPKTIEVTIEGESVTPNGERVEVAVGQDVELDVTADAPGTIHVHSSPEQELEYDAGESTVTIDGIDKPGTVDIESHELEKVIVQLEVR